MTLTDTDKMLLVERYQPRYLTPAGEALPEAMTFDEFLTVLTREATTAHRDIENARRERQEAERAARESRLGELRAEAVERRQKAAQEREARYRQASASIQATLAAAKENERLMTEVKAVKADPFQVISSAMDTGLSLDEAIKQLGGNK